MIFYFMQNGELELTSIFLLSIDILGPNLNYSQIGAISYYELQTRQGSTIRVWFFGYKAEIFKLFGVSKRHSIFLMLYKTNKSTFRLGQSQ